MTSDIEIEFEDVKKGIKFRLKGTPDVVDKYIEEYGYGSAMKEAVKRKGEVAEKEQVQTKEGRNLKISEIPEKPRANTLTEYITKLIYSEWGAPGRKSTEIIEVAKSHGITMSLSTLSGILHGLAKTSRLRRVKEPGDGQWKYYPPTSVVMGRE
ncbi:MAG: hypothetical protein KAT37_02275 [Candidatus Aenigmarchaeota archaeon]|nr:hypothetical protein [Candidatus Aenigmarchaeota archaeon]